MKKHELIERTGMPCRCDIGTEQLKRLIKWYDQIKARQEKAGKSATDPKFPNHEPTD